MLINQIKTKNKRINLIKIMITFLMNKLIIQKIK